ncbi:MAG: FAD-dependent oxidoreductase [Spirochaetes bacterium]|nr:FAD-dependent oxidoreductase [Spirochaetota bacterium]
MNRILHHPVLDVPGGRREVDFLFDGVPSRGYEGEILSSALFAAGYKRFSVHRKGEAPQGIFCANGQCSQCTVIVNGLARKSCVTPLAAGMDVRTLVGIPILPADNRPRGRMEKKSVETDILVIGGGPSGLSAAMELAGMGFSVVLADDKERLGGKLVLQTHKFFGSEEDCYAGTRGVDIARKLEADLRSIPNVMILANSPVVGIYKDRKAGVYVNASSYLLVGFKALVVAAGAREKSILFPGNDLPGVYGAGAFQTLVNRDLVKAADRVLVVGSGNVGLIGAYHALQAGISVAAIVEILPKINGYKVHADKIIRTGVPVRLNTTVVSVEGDGRVERATVARVDENWKPLLGTAETYEVDTVLIATGLSSCDEFYDQARAFGFPAVKAGDAEEIAEASSAMFGGRIAALSLAKLLGKAVTIDESWIAKREVLKSRPGDVSCRDEETAGERWRPVFFCTEEIPCNPCATVCPTGSITLRENKGTIMDLPYYHGSDCKGCMACVAACPGLAVSLIRRIDDAWTEVVLPFEFDPWFEQGAILPVLAQDGSFLEDASLQRKFFHKKYRTWLLTLKVSAANAPKAAGIRVQAEETTRPMPSPRFEHLPDDAVVCRCERVTVGELVEFIRANRVTDVNQLKTIRAGMGACGSKTCTPLYSQVFRKAGVDPKDVTGGSVRPLAVEVPMGDLVNEGGRP